MQNAQKNVKELGSEVTQSNRNVKGVVKPISGGFGFLQISDDDSCFISKENMKKLRPGDEVFGEEVFEGDRSQFIPSKLLNKGELVFLARVLRNEDRFCFVQSEESFDELWYYLSPKQAKNLNVGDLIRVELVKHPFEEKPSVRFVELIARHDDPTRPWKLAFEKNGIEYKKEFALASSRSQSSNVSRVDMTDKMFVTIDSASTKDMDDAIYVEKKDSGFLLHVAIADPTELVAPGTELFEQANRSGYTTYSPGWNVPMLNHELSEHEFSLIEGVSRNALMCVMDVSDSGELMSYKFIEAIIKSNRKLSYNRVSNWLEGVNQIKDDEDGTPWEPETKDLADQIRLLADFYAARSGYRSLNNLVFPDIEDISFRVEGWLPVGVKRESRRIANKIVEESMILANIAAANFFSDNNIKGVFVTHNGIEEELLKSASDLVIKLDSRFTPEFIATLPGYVAMRQAIDSTGDQNLDLLIRTMSSRSEFKLEKSPHFGLGIEGYATWTSPIRKFIDILNHIMIKSFLRGEDPEIEMGQEVIDSLTNSLIAQKRTEREINDFLNFKYLDLPENKGKEYEVTVIGVTRGGLRAVLDETDKLVFVSKLALGTRFEPARFDVDAQEATILKGRKVRLGDKLKVSIKGIDFVKNNLKLSVI